MRLPRLGLTDAASRDPRRDGLIAHSHLNLNAPCTTLSSAHPSLYNISLHHPLATHSIDDERMACYVLRRVRAQEDGRPRKVLGSAPASGRDSHADLLEADRVVEQGGVLSGQLVRQRVDTPCLSLYSRARSR